MPAGPERLRPTPVDYVSRAVVYLSLRTQSVGKAFHLINPSETPIDEMANWLRAVGYRLRPVSYGVWRDELLRAATRSTGNALYPLLPFLDSEGDDASRFVPVERFDCRHTEEGLKGSGFACPEFDFALMQRCLAYFRRIGFIDALPSFNHDRENGETSRIPAVSVIHAARED
jgi:hypothetical protein